jgi:hypothetical protein
MLMLIVRNPNAEHIVAQAVLLMVGFVAHTLIAPVSIIGLTLVYFDQRVRKEAFDLVMLLGPADPAPGLAATFATELAETMATALAVEVEPIGTTEVPLEPLAAIEDDGRV